MVPSTIGEDACVVYIGNGSEPGFCQIVRPVAASHAVTTPVMPIDKSRPFANTGVDFGPALWRAEALFIVKGASYPNRQSSRPVATSWALMPSLVPRREKT